MSKQRDRELADLASRVLVGAMRASGHAAWDELSESDRIQVLGNLAMEVPELRDAAKRIQPTWKQKFFQRRQLRMIAELSRPPNPLLGAAFNSASLKGLGQALGQIRFGVPVNINWFLRLDALVAQGRISEVELRRLLSTPGVDVTDTGEFTISRTSTAARWRWRIGVIALVSVCALAHFTMISRPEAAPNIGLVLGIDAWMLVVLLGLHWLGPRRWETERRLPPLLQ